MNRNLRTALLYLFVIVLGLLFLANALSPATVEELDNSVFMKALDDGRVVTVEVFPRTQDIEGTYYPDAEAETSDKAVNFTTTYLDNAALDSALIESPPLDGVKVNMEDSQIWVSLLT